MKDQFVTYEIAKRLKDLGFNEPCFGWYRSGLLRCIDSGIELPFDYTSNTLINEREEAERIEGIAAPLWQQAHGWLREKHGVFISILPDFERFEVSAFRGEDVWKSTCGSYDKARVQGVELGLKMVEDPV